DVTTRRVIEKMDYDATLINALTAGHVEGARIPVYLPNDRDAIAIALYTCGPIDPREAKVVRIKNTLELERMWISEALLKVAMEDPELRGKIEVIGKPREMQFDILGNLAR
ncbi:hypothetical protein J7L18_01045, partial [Candidatus Bathyarchaeota archaeon]|nr:hypothetical protein [Candidatus Bathyarchaeota archaeon]